jgi:hypothetical protein
VLTAVPRVRDLSLPLCSLSLSDIGTLVDAFPDQPLDFFGALRARRYDSTLMAWMAELGYPDSHKEVSSRLMASIRDDLRGEDTATALLPDWAAAQTATLPVLLATGMSLAEEQERVLENRLSETYFKKMTGPASGLLSLGG